MTDASRRLRALAWVLSSLLAFGTGGFMIIEGWSFFDSLYMTIITFSTVGYGETHELSGQGRVFASLLIGLSMVSVTFFTACITSIFVGNELTGAFRKKRDMKMINSYSDHTIVCGDGPLGRNIVNHLVRQQVPVVFLTNKPDEAQYIRNFHSNVPILEGSPTCEMSLADANVLGASTVIAALQQDVENLMIAITCNGLGTKLKVFCCAQNNEFTSRMFKVGASEVICPNDLCGKHLATMFAKA